MHKPSPANRTACLRATARGLVGAVLLAFAILPRLATAAPTANEAAKALEVQSLTVEGKPVRLARDKTVRLGPFPENVVFGFGPATNFNQETIRMRYRLEGFEHEWREGLGEMYLTIRFFNDAGDQVAQDSYKVNGESPGWNGSLTTSQLTHRRETIVVPPQASHLWVVISSGGPPATIGIYVVANLIVSKSSPGRPPVELIRIPFDHRFNDEPANQNPPGWMRDGNHSSMARIVEFGRQPQTRALAILDEDPISHAEWHSLKESGPAVTPGENLVVEWDEMYSMGTGNFIEARYDKLPPGRYQFHVAGLSALGVPTGVENSLAVIVPQPFWKTLWFWGVVLVATTGTVIGGSRYFIGQRMKREMVRLKNQRALEQERLRIARDIHDDLGARVTQICLVSAMAQENSAFPEKARGDFDRISQMSRELVSALYETVWAVNPENDNLDALGNYLCQMAKQLCERTKLRCRFRVLDLPHEVQVSSQTRHNITMAVKEAVHNVIKHAQATELTIRIEFAAAFLTVAVQDDGCGFSPGITPMGHGLNNMKKRLENIGGTCVIDAKPAGGTTVTLRLAVNTSVHDS